MTWLANKVRELDGGKGNVSFDYRIVARRLGFAIVGKTETHYPMRWRLANATEPGHVADARESARG